MAVVNPPYTLQAASASHPAVLFRRLLEALLFAEGVGNLAPNANGNFALPDDLKVSQNSPTGMSVIVGRGGVFIFGDDGADQGIYFVYNDANLVLTVAASDPTNPRKDIVVARVKDNAYGITGDTSSIEVVTGTPGPSPVEPSLPSTAYKLATLQVNASVTSILNANITDQRDIVRINSRTRTQPHCKAYATANQNCATGTVKLINLAAEEFKTDVSMHDNVTNNTRIAVPSGGDGLYLSIGSIQFAPDTNSRRMQCQVLKNGTQVGDSDVLTNINYVTQIEVPVLIRAVAGDYFEVGALQNAGVTIQAQSGQYNTYLEVMRVAD